ncbi:MAG: SGNH/GDSL hydrolase family protein [Burkholderiaceae bacterium]
MTHFWNWLIGFTAARDTRRRFLSAVMAIALGAALGAPAHADDGRDRYNDDKHWVGTWTASPQAADALVTPVPASFNGQTVRMIAHVSIGGGTLRVRFTNELGTDALVIGSAHVALQSAGSTTIAGTDRTLTFAGASAVTIPKGAPMLSDPVDLNVPALGNVVVTIYLPDSTPAKTYHDLARQTTYVSGPDNFTNVTAFPTLSTTASWFFVSAVEVLASPRTVAVVTLGDSITDGYASTLDTNHRWPNFLAERLQASRRTSSVAVMDEGISGNRVLHDAIGPNALARFDRDVLSQSGVKYVTVLEGINDFGLPAFFPSEVVSADDVIAGYKQLIARAHAHGLLIYGATLTPFEVTTIPGYYTTAGEAKRQIVNAWIRTSRAFDAVIDFDRAIRDPAHPTRMLAAFDSGDHLHPNDAGYRAMADAVDLRLFQRDSDR